MPRVTAVRGPAVGIPAGDAVAATPAEPREEQWGPREILRPMNSREAATWAWAPTELLRTATPEQLIAALQYISDEIKNSSVQDDLKPRFVRQIGEIFRAAATPEVFDRLYHSVDTRTLLQAAPDQRQISARWRSNLSNTTRGDWRGYSRFLDTVTGSTPTRGNRMDFLVDGPAVIDRVRPDIAAAKKSIDINVYQWAADDIGWQFARDVVAKANGKPPVKVRVMLDELGTTSADKAGAQKLIDFLKWGGVEVMINPKGLVPGKLNHRKSMIIDGAIAYTGGMNIGAEYQKVWHDQQTRVEGPLVQQIASHFRSSWLSAGGTLNEADKTLQLPVANPGDDESRVVAHRGDFEDTHIKAAYLKAFATAEKEILIANPYFTDPDVMDALKAAAQRGVKVKVILPAENDVTVLRAAARGIYPELIAAGVEIYEYPGRMAHQKVATVDGRWSTFGSSNLDARSLEYNDELNVVSLDPSLAAQINERLFKVDLAASKRITRYTPNAKESFARSFAAFL